MDEQKPFEWEKKKKLGFEEMLQPILGNLLLLIEEEKKRTIEKMEKTKQLLENMKKNQ